MIVCKELKEEFTSKELLFKSLKARKNEIIKAKKSEVKKNVTTKVEVIKSFSGKAPFHTKKGYFYPVINSTNIMDSHNDVHLESIWNKSAIEQNGKTSYVSQHNFGIDGLISTKNDVNIQLHKTTFKESGFDLDGKTTLLVYEIKEDSILHEKVDKLVKARKDFEQSVSMEYINIELCIDSSDKEFESEKKEYDKHFSYIANKDIVKDQGYYFAVSEAKISREGSAVLEGSNSATKVFYHQEETKETEPSKDTQSEPSKDTQANKIDYKYLIENLT